MHCESTVAATRTAVLDQIRSGDTIGLVPTMGALHEGHLSLIRRAADECDFVVSTIFVNPLQFGPNEDLDRYPRTLEQDLRLCRESGCDLVFTPSVEEMYPADASTAVEVSGLTDVLEGSLRPGHFRGVTTVVAKLFGITLPDRAYFGQKDYQQQLVIRRMVRDLNMPLEIVTCPIVREPDGLAMSSRNRYLTADERRRALRLSQALRRAEQTAADPAATTESIEQEMRNCLTSGDGVDHLEYAVVVDRNTLRPSVSLRGTPAVALIAARLGTTRLIDNTELPCSSSDD